MIFDPINDNSIKRKENIRLVTRSVTNNLKNLKKKIKPPVLTNLNLNSNHSFNNSIYIKQLHKTKHIQRERKLVMATLGGTTEVEYTQNSVEINNLALFALQEHNIKQVFIRLIFILI